MVNEQLEECRNDIATLQAERDEIDAKIFDPDQVSEILDELTNQLDSIGEKVKSAVSWQKYQLARNMLTNLEINNKNEVSFRQKKPLKHIFNNASTKEFQFGAPDQTRTEGSSLRCRSILSGAPGDTKLEPLGAATIIAHFLYENNEPGLFVPQHFTQKELVRLKAQENYKVQQQQPEKL